MQKGFKDVNSALHSKVECEAFDDEIAMLKQMMPVGQLESAPSNPTAHSNPPIASGPSLTSKELNKIR